MIILDTISYLLMWQSLDKCVAITTAHDYRKYLLSLPFWSQKRFKRSRKFLKSLWSLWREKDSCITNNQILKSLKTFNIFSAHNTPYSRQHHLWFLMRMKERLWGIDLHLFNGLYCYLMCFRIVLLMRNWKNIFLRNVSWNTVSLSLTASLSHLSWRCSE